MRGLIFHHWGVALDFDILVDAMSLTQYGERFFAPYFNGNVKQRAANNIGAGALVYEGVQGLDNDAISMWRLSIYGGITLDSGDGKQFMSSFGVMTGPKSIAERARQRFARGEYIIRPA